MAYDNWEGKQDVWQRDERRHCSLIVIGVNIDVERLIDVFVKVFRKTHNSSKRCMEPLQQIHCLLLHCQQHLTFSLIAKF
jgi:hypothetical protein